MTCTLSTDPTEDQSGLRDEARRWVTAVVIFGIGGLMKPTGSSARSTATSDTGARSAGDAKPGLPGNAPPWLGRTPLTDQASPRPPQPDRLGAVDAGFR